MKKRETFSFIFKIIKLELKKKCEKWYDTIVRLRGNNETYSFK